ncbi:MAG TPA: right-handed parallel beta-helix repeat-containing protein [Candidatus Angelobacter sp.]|jgi:hypothetical protein|nr:right-handed parallel beta-helix repeat-containing protein [Candidatus Angelobacter sp.]
MKKSICKLLAPAVALVLIGAGAPAGANTLYVSTQGNDSNPGTAARPFRTITEAYSQAGPGTTILVEPGTYTDYQSRWGLHLGKSGTAANPIVLKSRVRGGAIIDGQNAPDRNVAIYIDGSYNVVDGFEIKNGPIGGISIYGPGGNNNQILNNEINHNGNPYSTTTDGRCGVYDSKVTSGNIYTGNYIHDNGRLSQASLYDQGMYLCGTHNEVVINNLIARNCAYGIQVAAYKNIVNMEIADNTIVSNVNRAGIMLWGDGGAMNGIEITNNLIHGNGEPGIMTCSCIGSGVRILNNRFLDNSGHGLSGPWAMTCNGSTVSYTASGNITNRDPEFPDNADALAKLFPRH